MTPLVIIGALVAVLAMFLLYRGFKPGYRGAIGFKSRHASEISTLSLAGFSKIVKFFVLSDGGTWTVEYAPQLQLEGLPRGE